MFSQKSLFNKIDIRKNFGVLPVDRSQPVIALAGNPNTGKSTLFNALTGLRQHTGNWPGKTVLKMKGNFIYEGQKYTIVDLPGTYSLSVTSADEQVTRDFLCFAQPEAIIVVVDATCLERNLALVLQIMEINSKVIVCVNLIDEAKRKNIQVNIEKLSHALGLPVVATAACRGEGLPELLSALKKVATGEIAPRPKLVKYSPEIEKAVGILEPQIREIFGDVINPRWFALRLLEGDKKFIQAFNDYLISPLSGYEVLA